jgi:hypothetical protein
MPAWEYDTEKTTRFFGAKAAFPDEVGVSGENSDERFVRLLFIQFGYSL